MSLKMPQPWKHPKTGMYYFRRGVPADLQAMVGKRMEKRSLGTKDPQKAKERFAKDLAKCEARWAQLRSGARQLTEGEAHELAATVYNKWLLTYGDNPTLQLRWYPEWFDRLWTQLDVLHEAETPESVSIDQIVVPAMRRFCLKQTISIIKAEGLQLDEWSQHLLQRAVAAALQRASLKMRGVEDGTIDPRAFAHTIAALRRANGDQSPMAPAAPTTSTLRPLTSLLEGWWREAQAAGRKTSTYQSYRGTMKSFVSFVGHEDSGRITTENVIAFKDHRLNAVHPKTGKKASAKTVKDSDLAALKAIFGWAAANRLMESNPASGITIKLGKRPKLRPKGFSDEEARSILKATQTLMAKAELPATAAAKRWIPWLCAFTGARVGEIAQLRKEDVRFENGSWIIHVTPEADTVKTNDARDVVLHRQVVSLGFPEFVCNSEDGYLFFRVKENNSVSGTKKGLMNRLREFVRTIVTDTNVDPNHGWRHRFKTIGREVGIGAYILDAIQGHAPRTEGENYGEVSLKAIASAISALPEIDLDVKANATMNIGHPQSG